MVKRTQILVRGIVQGVGFRPYVYSLAKRRGLRGEVLNNESGVLINLQGEDDAIDEFVSELENNPPALSNIESLLREDDLESGLFADFDILPSARNGAVTSPVAADIATCEDCLRELFDRGNRRYRYPFINCTNCGPRFTIVEKVPYDRQRTTMRDFKMCAECRDEYEDPDDRRFHAEPTCCSNCGPQLLLSVPPTVAGGFLRYQPSSESRRAPGTDVVIAAQRLLLNGSILAIKGLGGYHLACDASNAAAVERLRKRKYREDKPFALMAPTLEVAQKYCDLSDAEKDLLSSPQRPIVLLDKNRNSDLPDAIAPRRNTIGFMLPYTPFHYLLLADLETPLVMTSGNISDEPIAYGDDDAGARLGGIADYFLLHDRRINIRTDDSVMRMRQVPRHGHLNANGSAIRNPQSAIFLRRSRGFAPAPITTSPKFASQILACGAELKNTFCLTRGHHAYVSHHIGDLENLETLRSFTDGIKHFKTLFDLEPTVIAYDLHPEYLSTKYALACDEIETRIGVQHHHAHIASCIADNDCEGEVIGIAMDGLGFGTDGKFWGGDFFVADLQHAERIAHLDYIPMPGGAKAIREPWRLAATYLDRTFGDGFLNLNLPFVKDINQTEWRTLRSMADSQTNSPETSSMGRLFDAVSALLGVRSSVNYEGQAAIELEAIADQFTIGAYDFAIAADGTIKCEPLIRQAVGDMLDGASPAQVSARFHLAVANLIVEIATQVRTERNLNRVALSGGVFQNMFLLRKTVGLMETRGFDVLTHRRVPANDGGISFGQAVIANAQIEAGVN